MKPSKEDTLSKLIKTYNGKYPAVLILNILDAYNIFGHIKPSDYKGFEIVCSEFIEKDAIFITDKENYDRLIKNQNK